MNYPFIAIVEDDLDDIEFISAAIQAHYKDLEIKTFDKSAEFLDFMKTTDVLPRLVVTDLRMPVFTGFEVIEQVRGNERTNTIPVVVLSTSGNQDDIERATNLGAAAYYVKPYDWQGYHELSGTIFDNVKEKISGFTLDVLPMFRQLIRAFRITMVPARPGTIM